MEHLWHIDEVHQLLKNARMTIRLKKGFFYGENINHLRHVISLGDIQVLQKTTKAAKKLQHPTTMLEKWSFLGFCSVSRRFVAIFARFALVPNKKLKESALRQIKPDGTKHSANDKLTKKFSNAPVLTLPRLSEQYTIGTDTCDTQVWGFLISERDGKVLKPVGCSSCTSKDVETRYHTAHKACLAAVWAVLLSRPDLNGTHFITKTDRHTFWWIPDPTKSSGRQACWMLWLKGFSFEIL